MNNGKPAGQDPAADEAGVEHQANTNQVRHEPVPASHDDRPRPAATERNEESARGAAAGQGDADDDDHDSG
jgi:hypothetical protein